MAHAHKPGSTSSSMFEDFIIGGYLIEPKALYPFALAYGFDCDFVHNPSKMPGHRIEPVSIKVAINDIHRERDPKSGLDRLKAVLLKPGRGVVFYPSHVESSMNRRHIVKETERDKEMFERWLEPFKERCAEAEIEVFRSGIRYASCKTPLLDNTPVIAKKVVAHASNAPSRGVGIISFGGIDVMHEFVGGYLMYPKDLYPLAVAFGADCDYVFHPTLPTGEYMDPLCIKTPINQVHRERDLNSGLDRLRGILLKSGRAAIFFPSHVEMSTNKQFIAKETKDRELFERWLEPFKERCTDAEIATFRSGIKYASCKTPLLDNRPVVCQRRQD
ncbi:hypothetical protein AX16_009802 [Volvariella volvacea WC 439]|nr:hypothetical protein AX16_009802 [Volvariella volvacea WC 439]